MSSFGPNQQTQQAMSQLGTNTGATAKAGGNLLNLGTANTEAGANFFRNIMGGNQAEGSALLAPDINRIREAQQGALQGISTMMPRGGGRGASLFQLPFEANRQIQSLYNPLRGGAASGLASIGNQETGAGSNLFGISGQSADALGNLGQNQQKITSQMWSNLAGGILGLATAPLSLFSGGMFGKLAGAGR